MFGKSEWFTAGRCGCLARPATVQGWLYLLIWAAVIFVPGPLIYAANHEVLAVILWLLPATAMFLFDLRSHARNLLAQRRREQDVFFIGFDDGPAVEAATPHYELRLRQ